MKKFILTTLLALISVWASTQNLELYYEGQLLDPDSEITISAHADSGMMVLDTLDVKNIANDSLDVKCARTIIDTVPGHVDYFCWGQCYSPTLDTSNSYIAIGPSKIIYEFSGDHEPSGIEGTMKVMYTFYDMNNPADQISIYVYYDATLSSINSRIADQILVSEVYPNPAREYASVDYDITGLNNAKIVIFNLLGSKVKEIELTDPVGTLKVNTSDLLEGIYFYSLLINNEALKTQKLIIKH